MRVANENKNLFQHYHNHNKVYHYCMFSKISRIKLIFSQIENLCDVEKSRKIFKFNNFAIKIVKYWVMNRSIILLRYLLFSELTWYLLWYWNMHPSWNNLFSFKLMLTIWQNCKRHFISFSELRKNKKY